MPTDTCIIESRECERGQTATKINAESELDKAIKWVLEEDRKMDEKYSGGPQPEQSMPYHIVRSLIKALQQAERERDAAVADLKLGKVCMTCKHDEKCRREVSETNQTQCIGRQRWTWRGLPQDFCPNCGKEIESEESE